jgi:[ribosomal protein S5]-alanine N-acetyltransferase
MPATPELQRLRAEHGPQIFAFEVENRAYFAASISDRGDDYFEHFNDRHSELVAEQERGLCAYYVLVEADGSVIGRFNLLAIKDGASELGYRVAQRVAGRGVATAAVLDVCRLAASQLGLRTLTARATYGNVASRKVLIKAGFIPAGPADVAGRPGTWYRRDLAVVTSLGTSPA